MPPLMQQFSWSPTRISSSGFATGRDFRRTAWTRVKMAVVATMPRARVRMAVTVKPGALPNCRIAYRTSLKMDGMHLLTWAAAHLFQKGAKRVEGSLFCAHGNYIRQGHNLCSFYGERWVRSIRSSVRCE